MSFAKYFEDNMEIIEERFALRQQENDHTPIYHVTQEVGSKIYLVTTKVVEVKPEAPKKHKRKKKKSCVATAVRRSSLQEESKSITKNANCRSRNAALLADKKEKSCLRLLRKTRRFDYERRF